MIVNGDPGAAPELGQIVVGSSLMSCAVEFFRLELNEAPPPHVEQVRTIIA
jgi:hypothetical protein